MRICMKYLKIHQLNSRTITQRCQKQTEPNGKIFHHDVAKEVKNDIIGPADPVSNLRPIIRYKSKNETPLEAELRKKQLETQEWNHNFWAKHNSNFLRERKKYIASNISKNINKTNLSADEMSVFYKAFLDKNWRVHVDYNIQWYKRNISLLVLSFRVNIQKLFFRKK